MARQQSKPEGQQNPGGGRDANHTSGERANRSSGGGRQRQGSSDETPFWEWVVAVVGAVLVAGAIGFMLVEAIAGDDSPPDVAVRVDSIRPVQGGYLVQFRAINQGGSTAAELTIEGELKSDTGSVEKSEATLNFVPAHSERNGGLFFTQDPRRYTLELRAKGYQEP